MTEDAKSVNQKQGVINKCPSCGGPLKAFSSKCELCGHELAGVGANRTVSNLVERFSELEAELAAEGLSGSKLEKELVARKARIIRDFPIPNAREDLQSLIYFIHPKVQENLKPDPNQEDWRVKFKEVLNMAKNAYKGDAKIRAEFEEIEKSLNVTLSGVLQSKAKRSPIVAIAVAVVVVLTAIGLGISQMDKLKLKQCQEKYVQGAEVEKKRLESVIAMATAQQREGKFTDALTTLNGLHWEYTEVCMTETAALESSNWDAKRDEQIKLVKKAENDEKEKQRVALEREDNEKREALEREANEKRAAEEKAAAEKLRVQAKEMATSRKAATAKEW